MSEIFPKRNQHVVLDWMNFVSRAFYVACNGKLPKSLEYEEDRKIIRAAIDKSVELLTFMIIKQKTKTSRFCVVALEGKGTEQRRKIYEGYKKSRGPRPIGFEEAYQESMKLLRYAGIRMIRAPHGEADDAIATYVKRVKQNVDVVVVSEDRDLWQLIDGDNVVVMSQRHGRVNSYACQEILSVPPENVACLKAYLGDSADDIPRAIPRMRTRSIEKLAALDPKPSIAYRKARKLEILSKRELDRVVKYKEQVKRNYDLVRLRDGLKLERLRHKPDVEDVLALCSAHNLQLTPQNLKDLTEVSIR